MLPCGSLGRQYFEKYGAPPDRMWYMPYEPDYHMIEAVTTEEIDATYRDFQLPAERRYILYCGRLVQVKRVDLLLSAFAEIAAQRPDYDLVIVGDGPLRAMLSQQLSADLRNRCHWIGFLDDQKIVARLQRGADVCVVPSDYEPWGVIINEAVAAGLALVVTDAVGAAAELVRDGVNGRVVPHGNHQAMADALLDVTDPAKLRWYRSATGEVLADWRRQGDPVAGLVAAFASAGIPAA